MGKLNQDELKAGGFDTAAATWWNDNLNANAASLGFDTTQAVATAWAASSVPIALSRPVLTGIAVVGMQISAIRGLYTSTPKAFTQKIYRDGFPVTGATGTSYTLTSADIGRQIVFEEIAENDIGKSKPNRSIAVTVLNNPLFPITLQSLELSNYLVFENSATGTKVGDILNTVNGSGLSLVDNAGGRFSILNGALYTSTVKTDYETAQSHQITIRETYGSNTIKDTVITVTVTNVFEQPNLNSLYLSTALAEVGTNTTIYIQGTTPGSVITATGLPPGLSINNTDKTIVGNPTAGALYSVTLTETLGDSANSPRSTTLTMVVETQRKPIPLSYEVLETAVGPIYTVVRILGDNSTVSLTNKSDPNFTITGLSLAANSPLGSGLSQTAIIREELNGIAVEYPIVFTGRLSLGPLSLSTTGFSLGYALTGTIRGTTPGSTLQGVNLPPGFSIDSATRTWLYNGGGSIGTFNFQIIETRNGALRSPRTTDLTITIINLTVPYLNPGPQWNGNVNSGYSSIPNPELPFRSTAKPILRPITPPNQYFNDQIMIGFCAAANNNGTLINNLGLTKVRIYCEGNYTDIPEPSYQSFPDANGNMVSYYAWWFILKRNSSINGHVNVYVEAIPQDTTMQNRVMGPFQFSPQDVVYDYQVTLDSTRPVDVASNRYQTFGQAGAFLRSKKANNPLITIVGGSSYDLGSTGAGSYQGQGYLNVVATVPITIEKTKFTTDVASQMRCSYDGIHFMGKNIKFDMKYCSNIYHEVTTGRQHWFDGIRATNSAGRNTYWRGMGRTNAASYFCRDKPYYTECVMDNLNDAVRQGSLARGCTLTTGFNDVATDNLCTIGNVVRDWDSSFFSSDVPAFTVTYNGPDATATISLNGANNAANRTFTCTSTSTGPVQFLIEASEAGMNNGAYWCSDLVNWVNSLGNGWSATLIDDSRRAAALTMADLKGVGFTNINVKAKTVTLCTMFDMHSDFWQQVGTTENAYVADNTLTNMTTQTFLPNDRAGAKDFIFFNNEAYNKIPGSRYDSNIAIFTQFSSQHSHVMMVHNTLASQGVLIRIDGGYTADSYCMIANNAVRSIVYQGGIKDDNLRIFGNHLWTGFSAPANSVNTTIGGDQTTMFNDALNGDFIPKGELLTNLKTPIIRYDIKGTPRVGPCPAGSRAR